MTVSVIIPVYNEESRIQAALDAVRAEEPFEIIVADGESTDRTVELAEPWARVVPCPRSRGCQLNHGASHASGDVLLFLHADARLAPGALAHIERAMSDPAVAGGNFDIEYESADFAARAFSAINRCRYHWGIFYGDSGIFCRRSTFHQLAGYREWPILEDYDFARRLLKSGRVVFLSHRILVSDRRWRRGGLFKTLWSWFWVQALYLAGVSPFRLARLYRNIR